MKFVIDFHLYTVFLPMDSRSPIFAVNVGHHCFLYTAPHYRMMQLINDRIMCLTVHPFYRCFNDGLIWR